MLETINTFFTEYRNTAWAFFSFFGFMLVVGKLLSLAAAAYRRSVDKIVEQALVSQRHDNQAQVIDRLLIVIEQQQEDIKRYCKAVEDGAFESAIVKKILNRYRVTVKD